MSESEHKDNPRLQHVFDAIEETKKSAEHMVSRVVDEGKPRMLDKHKELASTRLGRTAIKAAFEDAGVDLPKMYVKTVQKSYKKGLSKDIDEHVGLKNRRHVTNSIETIEGLGHAEKDHSGKGTLIIEFHGAFNPDNDSTAEIRVRSTPRPNTDNPGSPSQQVHNSNLRDPEWEDPPGDGDSEVLGSGSG